MDKLHEAINQARTAEQEKLAEQNRQVEAEKQQKRKELIAGLKLPFDEQTIALLPSISYEFWEEGSDSKWIVACFEYAGVAFKLWQIEERNSVAVWEIAAYNVKDLEECNDHNSVWAEKFYIYPSAQHVGYVSPEQRSKGLLLFIHDAIEAVKSRQAIAATRQTTTPKREYFGRSESEYLAIAARVLAALATNTLGSPLIESMDDEWFAQRAIELTDALLKQLS